MDLLWLAGLLSVDVLAELVDDSGEMRRATDVRANAPFACMAFSTVSEVAAAVAAATSEPEAYSR